MMKRNFVWTFFGNVFYAVSQWGIIVILAKSGSPVMVGQFAIGLAVAAPIFLLLNLNLRGVLVTDAKDDFLFRDYLGLRILTTLVGLTMITAIALGAHYQWSTSVIIVGIGCTKSLESISDVFYGLLQKKERFDCVAISLIFRGALSLIALFTGIYFGGNLAWGVFGISILWFIYFILYDIPKWISVLGNGLSCSKNWFLQGKYEISIIRPRFSYIDIRKLAWLSLPVGLVMMMGSLAVNIPRYYIDLYFGERELGIFAALAYIMVAGNTFIQALNQSIVPRLALKYTERDVNAFKRLFATMLLGCISIGVMGFILSIVGGREILNVLYSAEYSKHLDLFICLMLAAILSYVNNALGSAVTSMRIFRIQVPIHIMNIGIIFFGSLICIKLYGLMGAAYTILAGALFSTIAYGIVANYGIRKLNTSSLSIGLKSVGS